MFHQQQVLYHAQLAAVLPRFSAYAGPLVRSAGCYAASWSTSTGANSASLVANVLAAQELGVDGHDHRAQGHQQRAHCR